MNVSTDTCILINLLRVHRLDLLGAVPPYVFSVPAEVLKEIEYPDQQAELKDALDRGWIKETRLEEVLELQIFTRANEQLGSGESACIALAEARGWILGTDDSKGAGPFALAMFIGQQLTSIGEIQLFEYQDPGYIPSCSLWT